MKKPRPFQVSTFGLSPDMKRVHPAFGHIKRGDVSRQTLFEALEMYRRIDHDWGLSASHIAIASETSRHVVRVSGKQLMLALEGEPPAKAVPLLAEEIVTRLAQPTVEGTLGAPPPPPEPWWRLALSAVLVVAGVGLTVQALKPLFVSETDRPEEEIAWLTDPAELRAQQHALVGMFVTGQRQGDRSLAISPQGNLVFAELGPRQGLASGADSFRLGRREERTCLVTARNGIIEVINPNTLRYYGDVYRRLE